MSITAEETQRSWASIGPLLVIETEDEYDEAVERLDQLLDEVGTDQEHPLYTFLETLGILIEAYEDDHHPVPECGGGDVLRLLMDEHGLTQSGLPEVGTQSVVSEILSGKRELNVRQIRRLSERFGVSPAVFM